MAWARIVAKQGFKTHFYLHHYFSTAWFPSGFWSIRAHHLVWTESLNYFTFSSKTLKGLDKFVLIKIFISSVNISGIKVKHCLMWKTIYILFFFFCPRVPQYTFLSVEFVTLLWIIIIVLGKHWVYPALVRISLSYNRNVKSEPSCDVNSYYHLHVSNHGINKSRLSWIKHMVNL